MIMIKDPFDVKVEEFKRNELRKLYVQLTEKQQKFFNRLWGSVDKIPEDKIHIGVSQCEKTIVKNNKQELKD